MKGDCWEGGNRVPFVVRWLSVVQPRSVSDAMICFIDFIATFAEFMGNKFPEAATTDSRSFLPVLKSNLAYSVRGSSILNAKGPGGFTHWDGNPNEDPDGQLYDLAKDPS